MIENRQEAHAARRFIWLTGFDAPSCSTVYLDKPIGNHTLMQTIARANRVFPGKHSGLIVDYANVFASLERALAIYGAGKDGKSPVRDKQQLVSELRSALEAATRFCSGRREFLGHQRLVETLYGAVKLDPAALEFASRAPCLGAIADAIRAKLNPNPVDVSAVMASINRVLDASVAGIAIPTKPGGALDLRRSISRRWPSDS